MSINLREKSENGFDVVWEEILFETVGEGIERQMIVGEKMMICRRRFASNTVTHAHEHPHEQMAIIERGTKSFRCWRCFAFSFRFLARRDDA